MTEVLLAPLSYKEVRPYPTFEERSPIDDQEQGRPAAGCAPWPAIRVGSTTGDRLFNIADNRCAITGGHSCPLKGCELRNSHLLRNLGIIINGIHRMPFIQLI